jgi:hypothetical protein
VLGEVGEEELEHYGEVEEVSPEQKERENAEKRRALYDIMSCMRDIRKRTERTDMMFEPLKVCACCSKPLGMPTKVQQTPTIHGSLMGVAKRQSISLQPSCSTLAMMLWYKYALNQPQHLT